MISQQNGETVKKYFDCFKSARVNAELVKDNLTKHEELEKSESYYGITNNPEKVVEDKFLAMALLEYSEPERYNTLLYSLRNNFLTGADH